MSWIAELESLLPDKVSRTPEDLARCASDKWFASKEPDAVVFAESAADVSAVMSLSARHKIPVTVRGGGVGYVGGCVPINGGIVLAMERMNRILEINPADGVAVVQPGVITGELQDEVRKLGWYYPPDPASLRECSLGGNVATNAGGPRCLKYGVTRHYVLGLEVVLPNGSIINAGGRCHKNRQGFDLTSLFVGSEGMLGIVTEITLRLIPHPQARAIVGATFRTFAEAAAAVQLILGSGFLPSALEITDSFTLNAAREYLGPDRIPPGEAHLLAEFDGSAAGVGTELREVTRLLRANGAISIKPGTTDPEIEAFWQMRREFSYSLRHTGLTKLNEDVVVPRSRLVDLVEFAASLQIRSGFPVACFGHAGDGNIHVNIMVPDMKDPDQRARADAALDDLFRHVLSLGGVISGEHGIGIAKKRWFPDAVNDAGRALHQAVKNALDPSRLLNPGKVLG
jgi:glycolate oxidase subunit GlcD